MNNAGYGLPRLLDHVQRVLRNRQFLLEFGRGNQHFLGADVDVIE